MSDGTRTSEFLVTIAVLCAIVLLAALGERDMANSLIGVGLAVGAGGYAISRGMAKGGPK